MHTTTALIRKGRKMPQVKLISHQEDALEILLYTKSTRLQGEGLDAIRAWPMERKLEHLGYMRDTIRSSWEFANYIFEIKGVTRAFTHQLVRTRTASFAQETMRALDVRKSTWKTPEGCGDWLTDEYNKSMVESMVGYAELIDDGMKPQDARGVLPTNIHTSIIMGANLRTLSGMAELRLCTRTQGEYQDVFRMIRDAVLEVHPWAEDFLQVACAMSGVCIFPRYTECPIQHLTASGRCNIDAVKEQVKLAANDIRHEASPKVFQGATSDGGCVCDKMRDKDAPDGGFTCPVHGKIPF